MKNVTVVGGGFSGMATAYYLAKRGVPVTLLEKSDRLGGLLGTLRTEHGIVELAASGIRPSARVEALFNELGVRIATTKKESRARYLYRGGPRKWPLGFGESMSMGGHLVGSLVTGGVRPKDGETVEMWSRRVLGDGASRYIVGAVLQGIYAGDPAKLSAGLIFGKKSKPAKGAVKSSLIAPPLGLSELVEALEQKMRALGVDIRKNTAATADLDGTVIISTSARDASALIRQRAPQAAKIIAGIEMLPLIRVTAFYPASENTIGGFGILFPREQGVTSLGVLFNTNIFPDRGAGHSESWILGGAQHPELLDLDDEALFDVVRRDRRQVYGRDATALAMHPQRWPLALPHYDLRLEQSLRTGIELPPDTFLAGNYLRGIGLPMLLERAWEVAERVQPGRAAAH